jgi:hypothetical protein
VCVDVISTEVCECGDQVTFATFKPFPYVLSITYIVTV